ncbi:MAG: RNA ligase family protein, partial [Desulfotignum sp.]
LYPLTRAGYVANTSPFEQHHVFYSWVFKNADRFLSVLKNEERLCGEWLLVAHGTKYNLHHEPFVAFDIFTNKHHRMTFDDVNNRLSQLFVTPHLISDGEPMQISDAMSILGQYGFHGAIEQIEGAVWRIERNVLNDKNRGNAGGRHYEVDFLVKYVRPDKIDGKYLNGEQVLNM